MRVLPIFLGIGIHWDVESSEEGKAVVSKRKTKNYVHQALCDDY
jgi:hypothetical protein